MQIYYRKATTEMVKKIDAWASSYSQDEEKEKIDDLEMALAMLVDLRK